ncbi:MAG: hypothetical protein HMLKMBBP_01633 [Planctomycetes bacterium]|nr:hypothetical protein [Planctomycetota bacterium]
MGNGIIAGSKCHWLVAGWVARNAVDAIIEHLDGPSAPQIADRLRVVHEYLGPMADLRDAPGEDLHALANAARLALRDIELRGAQGWRDPAFFPGYLAQFHDLVAQLDAAAAESQHGA